MNRFDFQDTAKNPVTVQTQKRTSPKKKVEDNRATDTGITPNVQQGNPLKPHSEPGKVGTRRWANAGKKIINPVYFNTVAYKAVNNNNKNSTDRFEHCSFFLQAVRILKNTADFLINC